jgi:CheY-like chemotaxis protein
MYFGDRKNPFLRLGYLMADNGYILIVDDDEMNCEMLQLMLSDCFGRFLLASNGQVGLDLLNDYTNER